MTMFSLALLVLIIGTAAAGKMYYETSQNICPDQASRCSGTSSCCKMEGGQWGCCQFSQATCCSDNLHCCPQGYTCNMAKGECFLASNNATIPWAKKEEAATPPTPENLVCPDRTVCPGSYTSCCRTYSGSYRCCPYPNNVCCSDGYHCCARGYICDLYSFKCRPGFATSDWKDMTPIMASDAMQSMEWATIEKGN